MINTLNQKEQIIYIMGLLGKRSENDYLLVKELLEKNSFDKIEAFYYDLEELDVLNSYCSFISTAGTYAKVKCKDAPFNEVEELRQKHNISIPIE